MDIRNKTALKQQAARLVETGRESPRKLVLTHYLVSAAATALLTVLNYYLEEMIGQTGGLDGMGLRSILTTVRSVAQFAVTVLLPFWDMGLVLISLRFARGEYADRNDLPQGFSRFFPILRFFLLEILIYGILAFAALYTASFLYMISPFSGNLMQAVEQVLMGQNTADMQAILEQIDPQTMEQAAIPVTVLFGVLFAALALPASYWLRMAQYLIMDERRSVGAFRAILTSIREMRGNVWALVKLDISFWWYYLLRVLFVLVGSLDLILSAMGVTLPMSSGAAYFLCYAVAVVLQILLCWKAGAYLQISYALAYDGIVPPEQEQVP